MENTTAVNGRTYYVTKSSFCGIEVTEYMPVRTKQEEKEHDEAITADICFNVLTQYRTVSIPCR